MLQNTSNKCRAVTIHPPARLVGEPKTTKKRKEGRKKERHPKQWQTGYSPRPPTSSDQNQICMVGGLRCVVIHVKCDPNRFRVYGAVGGRKWPFPITLASGLYNSLYYRTSRDQNMINRIGSTYNYYNKYTRRLQLYILNRISR